jgi:glutathione S-transferase
MELFYGRVSGNSARAMFGLLESGASWEARFLDTRNNEHRAPEYLAINPMGKIPALVDGGLKLWESNAINWYAAEKHPASGLVPETIASRASMQRWLFFQTAHVSPACHPIIQATNARVREFRKVTPDAKVVEAARADLLRYLPVLEEGLAGRDWLEGAFSLADVAYAPHLVLVAEGGFDFAAFPRVRAWIARLQARLSWRRTMELVFGG